MFLAATRCSLPRRCGLSNAPEADKHSVRRCYRVSPKYVLGEWLLPGNNLLPTASAPARLRQRRQKEFGLSLCMRQVDGRVHLRTLQTMLSKTYDTPFKTL
jgi:hypothetical protein